MFKRKDEMEQARSYEMSPEHILEVRDLNVRIAVDDYSLHAVRGVTFPLRKRLALSGNPAAGRA